MTVRQEGRFSVHHDSERNLFRLEIVGRLTLALTEASADATYTLPDVTSTSRLLVDCRKAELDEVNIGALRDYQKIRTAKGYPVLRTAVVVSAADLTIAELWAAVRNSAPEAVSRVFADEDSALQWLFAGL